ncbi:MAG: PGF-pre-PGF domain-containing protein [Candidatus Methanoperedens sp.]|nr:PGF-pre-PGF domain-containing protein [Candidatus Methanoperedens sp.]
MRRAWIVLLLVSTVIGMAIPAMANLDITRELNIDISGTNEATSSADQTQRSSDNMQNNDNQDAIAGDATANSVASASADAVDRSYSDPDSTDIPTSTDTPTPTATSPSDPTSTPAETSAPPASSTPVSDSTSDIILSTSANAQGGSGEGSGCGGGAITRENLTNIKQHESKEMQVSTGSIVYRFTTLDFVKEAGFTARTDEGCIMARAELLKGRPMRATSDVPGAIYFNVWAGAPDYGGSSKIEAPYIIFSIPDAKNNEPVKLLMLKDSWTDLRTEKIGPGTYKAYTSGFGSFAIAGTHEDLLRTSPEVQTQSTVSPTVTITAESVPRKPVNLVLISVVLVVLTVMVYLLGKAKIIHK